MKIYDPMFYKKTNFKDVKLLNLKIHEKKKMYS